MLLSVVVRMRVCLGLCCWLFMSYSMACVYSYCMFAGIFWTTRFLLVHVSQVHVDVDFAPTSSDGIEHFPCMYLWTDVRLAAAEVNLRAYDAFLVNQATGAPAGMVM